jgi:hypothetical protein
MNPRFDWLDNCIGLMQADKSLGPHLNNAGHEPNAEDIAMLQIAARLNGSRPGAGTPDQDFLERLRARMLAFMLE